ncbi:MAG TPA: SoxR reducing system RseC family protein [Bacillota bacterium]|nr:SoxR reducing system RseC family protein [Bacillota bacterium]HOR85272.1 SoxR reducing system RseC family protein [Bacillota bacterium]HPL54002.1 SoxR reducing system RseC family protein [Bacillota bacterium]
MKEIGKVIKAEEDQVVIFIKRGTACGDCGKCQVGKEKLGMVMTTDNTVGAQEGDEVEIELENINLMVATLIAYGFPLFALAAGIIGGYYGSLVFGLKDNNAQAIGAALGLAFLAASYIIIKYKDKSISKIKKLKPVITGIRPKDSI